MLRLRTVVPFLLLSSFANPALGETTTSYCAANAASPRCEAERAREFARARNAEIDASLAAVAAARAWIASSTTHCKTPNSTTPRCQAERAHELDLARTRCKAPRCEAERAREFAKARNAEIDAALAAVKAERERTFAERRNAEIEASMAAVKRARIIGPSLTYCMSPNSTTPRCEAERAREFAKARNAEINASMATVAAVRGFARARNAEIEASLATVKRDRAFIAARNAEINASIATVASVRELERARNAEIDASLAAVKRERARAFAAARNAEINASMAASKAQRALRLALEWSRQERLETGAISLPTNPRLAAAAPVVRRTRQFGTCREAARLLSPLRFSDGSAEIEPAMKPELDRIAMMARSCPAVRFEIHGYSDNSGPAQVNRHLAQRRAQATLEYLVGSGVDRERLAAIGRANAQPLAPNTNEDNRALNRRVEITIHDPATFAAARRVMWDLAELLDPTYVPPLARLSP